MFEHFKCPVDLPCPLDWCQLGWLLAVGVVCFMVGATFGRWTGGTDSQRGMGDRDGRGESDE